MPERVGACYTDELLFTVQEPLIATIRGGIPSFAAQKPPPPLLHHVLTECAASALQLLFTDIKRGYVDE